MKHISDIVSELSNQWHQERSAVTSPAELEALRVRFVGRNGLVPKLMSQLKQLSLEDKRVFGPQVNALNQQIHDELTQTARALEDKSIHAEIDKSTHFDVTASRASKTAYTTGSLHPYTQIIEHIEDIFSSMGFTHAQGPEVETEWYNFEALNIPADHPARDLHDTFWLTTPGLLLRTHTSTVQIRTLQQQQPPLAIFTPGRVFRHEATDATHDYMFMQCEGLMVDKKISLTHLCSLLKVFFRTLFNKQDLSLRLRPSYFPFVEPGLEIDISCIFCKNGCAVCKKTQWIEIGGSGLVHPHVLASCGIDPTIYAGCAWGLGIERIAMLMYGIDDIRLFHTGNLQFLKQF